MPDHIIILDCESTGLVDPIGVVEVGMCEISDDLDIISEFSSLVHTDIPIAPEAEAKHGISAEAIVDAPQLKDLPWPSGEVILCCHNVPYDYPLVKDYMNIVGTICTLRLARRLLPMAPNHQLDTLATYCDLPKYISHRTYGDVRNVWGLLCYMSEGSGMNVWQLLEWLKRPLRFKTMPYGKHRGLLIDKVPYQYLRWLKAQPGHDPDMELTLSHV